MTINEAIERAGAGAFLEGVTDSSRVIGLRVLSRAGDIVATFNSVGLELAPPPLSDEGTSNPQFVLGPSGHEDAGTVSFDPASETLTCRPSISK
jgi:hypothetical protein